MSKEFSLTHFRQATDEVAAIEGPYPLSKILEMYDEITNLFHCLGSAMSFATSDVTQKIGHVENRTKEMIEAGMLTGDFSTITIQDVMLAEKAKNWHMSGPEGIEGKGRDFQNASRSMVRLVWFLDFVYEMIHYLRINDKDTLPTAVKYAYNTVLSPRHNMLVRNAFKVAVLVCPSKETFLEKVSGDLTPEQVNDIWIDCETSMKKISDKLWAFFKSEGMDELP